MRISRAETFRGFHGSLICYGLPGCSAPCPDLTGFPAIGAFYFQASNRLVTLPVAGYNYSVDWTPTLAGLSPAGMAARLAARHTSSLPTSEVDADDGGGDQRLELGRPSTWSVGDPN